MSDTERSILGSVPDLDDGPTDVGGVDSDSSEQGSSNDGRSSAQPTTEQPQPRQQVRRRHDGLVEVPNEQNPNTRDLVDPVSGRVVAQGGIERRIYEDSQRTQRENNALKQQVAGMQNALRSSNEVLQEAARLGVQPQDQLIAVRVMADFMRDPVRTLQSLVEEVKSKGYQIPFLTDGVTQGMDMSALSRMIDGKLQPIMQQRQQELQQQQFRQQAERDVQAFTEANPESTQNLDVLSEMLQAQPGLPLHEAYTKMIRWAHENGLDWTQPLKQQIAALRQQQTTPQQPPESYRIEQRPLPGRRSVTNQQTQRVNGATGSQFNENASWSDIIRDAMRESGVQLN